MNYQEYDIVRIDNKEYVIAKTSEINSNKYLLLVRELAICSAKNDLPTLGSATKQYNPLDFIIPSIMLSFLMSIFICSIGIILFSSLPYFVNNLY